MNTTLRVVALGLAISSTGCRSDRGVELHQVVGRVTYAGQPAADATVAFHSDQSPRLATGRTDAAGSFVLTTFDDGDGAVAAEYVVTVTKFQIDDSQASRSSAMDDAMQQPQPAVQMQSHLPDHYGSASTSPLRCTVSRGTNEFVFDLERRAGDP